MSFVALLEISALVANLGLPWLTARFLPEFRLHAPGERLHRFAWGLVGALAAVRVVWTLALALALPWLLDWGGLQTYRDAAFVYLGVLLVEGLARHLRDDILGALMRQKAARTSLVMRQAAIFVIIAPQVSHGSVGLQAVIVAELAASVIGLIIALLAIRNHLQAMRTLPGEPGWKSPPPRQMLATAAPMYAVGLLATVHEPPMFQLILQRMLGTDVAAAFGFLRHLHQYVLRYLPARLLAGLVRPKLVAAYVGGGGDGQAITDSANLAGKLNLFVLMPVLAFASVHAELLVDLLSGGKFAHTGWLLFGLLLALMPQSERALLEVVAVATGHSSLCARASLFPPLALPLMVGLILLGAGVDAAVVALIAGHLVFVVHLQVGLSRRIGYRPDLRGLLRLMLSAALAAGLTAGVDTVIPWAPGWSRLALGLGVAVVGFLAVARLFRPFTAQERARVNNFLRRRLFVW